MIIINKKNKTFRYFEGNNYYKILNKNTNNVI